MAHPDPDLAFGWSKRRRICCAALLCASRPVNEEEAPFLGSQQANNNRKSTIAILAVLVSGLAARRSSLGVGRSFVEKKKLRRQVLLAIGAAFGTAYLWQTTNTKLHNCEGGLAALGGRRLSDRRRRSLQHGAAAGAGQRQQHDDAGRDDADADVGRLADADADSDADADDEESSSDSVADIVCSFCQQVRVGCSFVVAPPPQRRTRTGAAQACDENLLLLCDGACGRGFHW